MHAKISGLQTKRIGIGCLSSRLMSIKKKRGGKNSKIRKKGRDKKQKILIKEWNFHNLCGLNYTRMKKKNLSDCLLLPDNQDKRIKKYLI